MMSDRVRFDPCFYLFLPSYLVSYSLTFLVQATTHMISGILLSLKWSVPMSRDDILSSANLPPAAQITDANRHFQCRNPWIFWLLAGESFMLWGRLRTDVRAYVSLLFIYI